VTQIKVKIMKKFYLLTLSALTAIAVNAQKHDVSVKKQKMFAVEQQANHKPVTTEKATIWESDFSTAADWTTTHDPADCSLDWSIGSVSCGGSYPIDDITSTTASNGWAIVDSDLYGGATGGNEVEDSWLTTAMPIDLSTYPNVVVEFETYYRSYSYEKPFLVVGVADGMGGVTWPTDLTPDYDESTNPNVFRVFPEGVDNPTANPYKVQINVSSVAGGQSAVYFRLNWTGTWGYAWFVDDFKVLEQPANDIIMLNEYFAGVNNEGIEYGRTPADQLDDSYDIGGSALNFGVDTQTGTTVDIDFGSFATNHAIGDVVSGDTTQFNSIETPALPVGLYEGTYTIVSNEEDGMAPTFGDNVLLRNFEVTADVYSQDGIDVQPASILSLGSLGSNSFTSELSNTVLATMYHFRATDNYVNGIQIALSSGSVAGGELTAAIIDTATFLADGIGAITGMDGNYAESQIYTLTSTDISNGYANVYFDAPISLAANAYYVAANCYYIDQMPVRVLDDQTVAQPWYASMIHLVTDGNSYSNGNALAIRVLQGAVGIEETLNNSFDVYPNPATDVVNVNFKEVTTASVSVMNVAGKEVMSASVNGTQTSFSTVSLSNGVYFVKVNNGASTQIKKIVVKK
jgi:hypothetical protein